MVICPECGWASGNERDCERCAATLVRPLDNVDRRRPDENAAWVTIARFGNAAEAGYFAHELSPVLSCEPRIEYQDDFDAVGGAWRTGYLLTVPERLAERGRTHLGAMLDGNWDQEPSRAPADDGFFEIGPAAEVRGANGPQSRINWVPIMLTLAAGSAVFWAGKKAPFVRRHVNPGEAGQRDLFDVLADGAHPWVQHHEEGGGKRELRINARAGTATLLEDTDGDGRFDTEFEFPVDVQ